MAKIAIDARELSTSTGRYVERLIFYLQKIDKANNYLILLKPEDYTSWQPSNDNFEKVLCSAKEFTWAEQTDLKKQLNQLRPNLVHFPMVQQPILYRGIVVTSMLDLTTARFKNPTKNGILFWLKQQVYKFVNWRVAHKSKQIITISNYVKKDVANFAKVPLKKITTTYLAADEITEAIKPIKELQSKQFIFYVGRPQPHKNLARLIEAFSLLKKTNPELLLVLAGKKDKMYDSFIQTAKDLGVEDSVVFTGFVSEGQLKWLYKGCKAFVFPSLSEGFGLPGLEAMQHGAPVVSSNATCLPEIYGDAAYYFDPLDIHDIASSINTVINDTNIRNKLIKDGRKKAKEYSWERMAKQTLEVYKKALS
jgi:glycosyltransferase involved in cell wall biosynthesis